MKLYNQSNKLILCALFAVVLSCVKINESNVEAVAKVGQVTVSMDEFIRSYEMLMLNTEVSDSKDTRQAHINSLIERKLLAMAGRSVANSLDEWSLKQVSLEEEKAIRELLFKKEIEEKTDNIDDVELREHFTWLNTELHLKHIFVRDSIQVFKISNILEGQPAKFDSIATTVFKDSTLSSSGGDLGWVSYDVLDPNLEINAYRLKIDSISKPVRSSYGWHVLKKINERKNVFLIEDDFMKEKKWLKNKVKQKKLQIRADRYVNHIMTNSDIRINEDLSRQVLALLSAYFKNAASLAGGIMPKISRVDGENLLAQLSDLRGMELASVEGESFLVTDLIDNLPGISPDILINDLGTAYLRILRDKRLTIEGRSLGLDKDSFVSTRIKDVEDEYYSGIYIASLLNKDYDPLGETHISAEIITHALDSLSAIYPSQIFWDTINTYLDGQNE